MQNVADKESADEGLDPLPGELRVVMTLPAISIKSTLALFACLISRIILTSRGRKISAYRARFQLTEGEGEEAAPMRRGGLVEERMKA